MKKLPGVPCLICRQKRLIMAKELSGMYRQKRAEKQQQEDLKAKENQNDMEGPAVG